MRIKLLAVGTLLLGQLASAPLAGACEIINGSAKAVDETLLSAAIESVADKMRDPASSQFRRLKRSNHPAHIVCGEVNAKNAYGGYVGFKPFAYSGRDKSVTILPDEDDITHDLAAATLQISGCPR